MGREVRRVPVDWEHPKDGHDNYLPLMAQTPADWDEGAMQWKAGFVLNYRGKWEPKPTTEWFDWTWKEYAGERPSPYECMPDWPLADRTHWQMYEDTSEGTPISPVFETPEELAHWLADNGASAFADMIATYSEWLSMIKKGYAPCAIISSDGIKSGVEMATDS